MKKILFLLLFSISSLLVAQQAVYFAFSPGDRGIGVRYDCKFLYASFTKGFYYFNDCNNYIKNHSKFVVGAIYKDIVTAGLTYHQYKQRCFESYRINQKAFTPLSFELGVVARWKVMSVGFTMDLLKWEGCVCIGLNIKKSK